MSGLIKGYELSQTSKRLNVKIHNGLNFIFIKFLSRPLWMTFIVYDTVTIRRYSMNLHHHD